MSPPEALTTEYAVAPLLGGMLASETTNVPERVNAKPNGVPPTEACEIACPRAPSGAIRNVSIVFDVLLVTTATVPAGLTSTWAGPASPAANRRHAWWIRAIPPCVTLNPTTLGDGPALRTYTWRPCAVTLMGSAPPDRMTSMRRSHVPDARNTEIVLLAALTA